MSKLSMLTSTALVGAALLGGAVRASAQQAAPSPPAAQPQGGMDQRPGMMQGGMMPMEQMSKMMENCNKMMQTMMDRQGQGGSGQQPAPQGNRG